MLRPLLSSMLGSVSSKPYGGGATDRTEATKLTRSGLHLIHTVLLPFGRVLCLIVTLLASSFRLNGGDMGDGGRCMDALGYSLVDRGNVPRPFRGSARQVSRVKVHNNDRDHSSALYLPEKLGH